MKTTTKPTLHIMAEEMRLHFKSVNNNDNNKHKKRGGNLMARMTTTVEVPFGSG
jgi:hypothetical protein